MKTKEETLKEFGARVKRLRIERGLTMDEFAKRCGYNNRSTAYMIETGKQDVPLSKLKEIASVLGVDTYYLWFGEEKTNKTTTESKTIEVTDSELELLVEFRKLSGQEQDFLIKIMKK